MRIGIVCYPTFGGSGVVATELGKIMAQKGHTVHFITYDRPVRLEHFARNIFFHQVTPPDYPLFHFLPYESALASKMVEVGRYEKLDVFHVHYAIPHASTAFMAREILSSLGYRVPVVTTLHGTDITLVGKDAAYEPVVTFSINKSNGVTSVSEYLKQNTLKNFPITQSIEVIPNFVDVERFSRKKPKSIEKTCIAQANEKILVHISNFRPVKRVTDVVELFSIVQKQISARLLLVGDGPERSRVEHLVREKGLTENVRFLGKQEAIEDVLAFADLFILPSESESFGLSALEAMACGVPVIGSAAGGLPEVVVHGECGFLSPIGAVEDMADNAILLLTKNDLYSRFSLAATETAHRFTIDKIVPAYENLYQRVIDECVC